VLHRPIIGGLSITEQNNSPSSLGTMGILVRDNEDNSIVALTNAHVALSNPIDPLHLPDRAVYDWSNSNIVQPATYESWDGTNGSLPSNPLDNKIGKIKRSSFYNYAGMSFLAGGYTLFNDVAILHIDNNMLSSDSYKMKGFESLGPAPFATTSEIDNLLTNNNSLYISSRTTGSRGGSDCRMSVKERMFFLSVFFCKPWINFSCTTIVFYDVFKFEYDNGEVGAAIGGDSGSAVLADINGITKVVGLLFAGTVPNGISGFFCRIDKIASEFNVSAWDGTNIVYSNPSTWEYISKPLITPDPEKYNVNTDYLPPNVIIENSKKYYRIGSTSTIWALNLGQSANYKGQANWNGTTNGNVTTVGSNGDPSFYGTYDQSGNVFEWNDLNNTSGSVRGLRGGSWFSDGAFSLSSSSRYASPPSSESSDWGFRLASSLLNLSYFVNVVDIGNSNDITGYGGVNYVYSIGKYLVTNCEYVEFLNAVASTDTYDLYRTNMNSDVRGGITRSGSSGSFTYSIKTNMGNKPVVYVSWFDCARYCNWLHNNKPTGPQDNSTTENGAYTLNGATSGNAVPSNSDAKYRLPTENEWYKAAYYKGGSTNASYWVYATQSNTAPTPVTASSTGNGLLNGQPARGTDYVCQ